MSSLRGARIAGKRACSASTIAEVSSTESVVWVRKARLASSGTLIRADVVDRLDEGDRARGHLAEGSDHFGVSGMADEEDVAAVLDQPLRLAMDLGDERAGRIDVGKPAALRRRGHRFGHSMRGKDDGPVVGHLVELVDEHRAEIAQPVDDEAVMDDFMADIDRRSEPLERELDDLDRAVDSGAKAARCGDQHLEGRAVQHSDSHLRLRLQP